MTKFEDELTFILGDFKQGRINYADTVLKIERLIENLLGFSAASNERFKEMEKRLKL